MHGVCKTEVKKCYRHIGRGVNRV